MGVLIDLMGFWHWSEEFLRKKVIGVLCVDGIMCVKYMI